VPAGEQREENLLDDLALTDDDLAQLGVNLPARGEELLDDLLLGGLGERRWGGRLRDDGDGFGGFGGDGRRGCFVFHSEDGVVRLGRREAFKLSEEVAG